MSNKQCGNSFSLVTCLHWTYCSCTSNFGGAFYCYFLKSDLVIKIKNAYWVCNYSFLFIIGQDCWKREMNANLHSYNKLVAADWPCTHIQTPQHWTFHYLLHHRCRSQSLSGERQHHCRSWQCQPVQLATTTGKQMYINHVGQRPSTGSTFTHVPTSIFSYLYISKPCAKGVCWVVCAGVCRERGVGNRRRNIEYDMIK